MAGGQVNSDSKTVALAQAESLLWGSVHTASPELLVPCLVWETRSSGPGRGSCLRWHSERAHPREHPLWVPLAKVFPPLTKLSHSGEFPL